MRRLSTISGILACSALLAVTAHGANSGAFTLHGNVTHVVDGDTVDVRLDNGRRERVRLIGIDTPEVGQCGFAKASGYAHTVALGRTAVLVGDATQTTRDRYGRLLAYVWAGGRDLGYQQLERGFARVYVYDRPFQRLPAYRRAERAGRGRPDSIWRGCSAPAPAPQPAVGGDANCDPSYPTVCIPPPPPDLDCADVPYTNFRVVGADPHHFDGDRDGIGCES
jgi:micrococcal nuclease